MQASRSYSATEFKAKCLDILDQLSTHTLTRVTVTKRGKVVAVLTPPEHAEDTVSQLHGFMRGSVAVPPGMDLTDPVLDELLSADEGLIHA